MSCGSAFCETRTEIWSACSKSGDKVCTDGAGHKGDTHDSTSSSFGESSSMSTTPSETIRAYVHAFETLHAEEIVPFYFLPCTFIRPDGTWVVQDDGTAVVLVRHLLDHAISQGYRNTVISQLTVRALAPALAEAYGNFERFDAQGASIGRFGFTYVLREVHGQWKIIVAIAHDPSAVSPPS
jgi:hypothetical protein